MVEKGLQRGGGLGRPRLTLTALALSLLASGCYSYTVVSPAAVPPGSEVRLTVSPQANIGVSSDLLPQGNRSLRGRLMEGSTGETLRLSVPVARGDAGMASRQLRSAVSVPMADVQQVELRRFEKGRTGAVAGGGLLASYIILRWAFNVLDPSPDGGDATPPGADNARFVLFRLSW